MRITQPSRCLHPCLQRQAAQLIAQHFEITLSKPLMKAQRHMGEPTTGSAKPSAEAGSDKKQLLQLLYNPVVTGAPALRNLSASNVRSNMDRIGQVEAAKAIPWLKEHIRGRESPPPVRMVRMKSLLLDESFMVRASQDVKEVPVGLERRLVPNPCPGCACSHAAEPDVEVFPRFRRRLSGLVCKFVRGQGRCSDQALGSAR
jgi:hypothetical protein